MHTSTFEIPWVGVSEFPLNKPGISKIEYFQALLDANLNYFYRVEAATSKGKYHPFQRNAVPAPWQ